MDLRQFSDADGIILRRTLEAIGISDKALYRAAGRGEITRIKQGAYVVSEIWDAADDERRHQLCSTAVRAIYDEDVALSHVSACIEYGAPTWGHDLSMVHLTQLGGHGERKEAGVVHHRGRMGVLDVTRDETGWLTSPTRTALDAARLVSQEAGVVLLDWFLHAQLTTEPELEACLAGMRRWPGTIGLRRVLQLADGLAESVAETRTRLLCRSQGLPVPVAQYVVRHPDGRVAARVDFAWPEYGVLLEFDGREKYEKFRRPGESVADAVIREKRREDMLRELTGWIVIRLTWADLARPAETAARIRRALTRAA